MPKARIRYNIHLRNEFFITRFKMVNFASCSKELLTTDGTSRIVIEEKALK